MENASKALLIAGAILIVILLIAVGMIVYNNSKSTIDAGIAQMDSTEIQMFNSQFTNYEGKQSGTNVKALLNAVAANNATYKDDTSKQVTITNATTSKSGTNQTFISNFSSNITPTKTYDVTMTRSEQGLISNVTIK